MENKPNDTRDRAIRTETEVGNLKEDLIEMKDYLKKHFRNIYVLLGVLILALVSMGIIEPNTIIKYLAKLL